MKSFVALSLIAASCSVCLAEKNSEITPVLAKPGDVVFADDFESPELGPTWAQIRGEWKVVDGEVIGKEIKSDKHAAVFHCKKKNRDSIVRFSFKLKGADGFHFSLNHARGHLFRVMVSGDSLIVRTDVDKKDKSSKSEVVAKARGKFEQEKWYTMQVEMVGDKVAVTTDNGLKITGQNARLDTDKPNYRFILKGEHLALDDIIIRAVK